jgi:hypothetical protein
MCALCACICRGVQAWLESDCHGVPVRVCVLQWTVSFDDDGFHIHGKKRGYPLLEANSSMSGVCVLGAQHIICVGVLKMK